MRFVTFAPSPGIERFGVQLTDGRIADLEGSFAALLARDISRDRARGIACEMAPANAIAFIEGGEICLDAARRAKAFVEANGSATGPRGEKILFQPGEITLKAPLPRPRKFIAAGKNHLSHQKEMQGREDPEQPKLPIAHVQFASTVVGPEEPVAMPKETKHMDYEVELAVVIGKRAWNVSKERARDYVFGYTIFNDLTDRDMYRGEYFDGGAIGCLGKNFAGFSPMGPVLVTKDEIADPYALYLRSRVNGEIRQDGSAKTFQYNVEDQVSHWSRIGLDPGDMLGTGTPGGVAAGRKKGEAPWWLKKGDTVECEIENIGVLRTRIV
jgi:acylpyruvate hydrolase